MLFSSNVMTLFVSIVKFYKAHMFSLNSQFLQHISFQAAGHVSSVLGTKLQSAMEDTQRALKIAVQRRGVLNVNTKTISFLILIFVRIYLVAHTLKGECRDEE